MILKIIYLKGGKKMKDIKKELDEMDLENVTGGILDTVGLSNTKSQMSLSDGDVDKMLNKLQAQGYTAQQVFDQLPESLLNKALSKKDPNSSLNSTELSFDKLAALLKNNV